MVVSLSPKLVLLCSLTVEIRVPTHLENLHLRHHLGLHGFLSQRNALVGRRYRQLQSPE